MFIVSLPHQWPEPPSVLRCKAPNLTATLRDPIYFTECAYSRDRIVVASVPEIQLGQQLGWCIDEVLGSVVRCDLVCFGFWYHIPGILQFFVVMLVGHVDPVGALAGFVYPNPMLADAIVERIKISHAINASKAACLFFYPAPPDAPRFREAGRFVQFCRPVNVQFGVIRSRVQYPVPLDYKHVADARDFALA
tara:strand:+ start:367 stop:945 length:579 start_codon:yes stop_codon:yes gene_type:complete